MQLQLSARSDSPTSELQTWPFGHRLEAGRRCHGLDYNTRKKKSARPQTETHSRRGPVRHPSGTLPPKSAGYLCAPKPVVREQRSFCRCRVFCLIIILFCWPRVVAEKSASAKKKKKNATEIVRKNFTRPILPPLPLCRSAAADTSLVSQGEGFSVMFETTIES